MKMRRNIKTTIFISACLFLATLVAGPFLAQEVVIYPAKGQSQDQMEKDKYECYRLARDQLKDYRQRSGTKYSAD